MGIGVGVKSGVGVKVGVGVGVIVFVGVIVGVGGLEVSVTTTVAPGVRVGDGGGVPVAVGVWLGVAVGVKVGAMVSLDGDEDVGEVDTVTEPATGLDWATARTVGKSVRVG